MVCAVLDLVKIVKVKYLQKAFNWSESSDMDKTYIDTPTETTKPKIALNYGGQFNEEIETPELHGKVNLLGLLFIIAIFLSSVWGVL